MNDWDALDNIKMKNNLDYPPCEECGATGYCVSSSGMENYGREGEMTCNHCFDKASGDNECKKLDRRCDGCIHSGINPILRQEIK